MIDRLAGGRELPRDVVDQIIARTDGVPLFIEELTKAILESGVLRSEGQRYVLTAPLPSLAIPTTLHASLMARLDRLAPVRQIAEVGAVIGREFSHELITAVSQWPESDLNDALQQLVASELIYRRGTPPDAVYAFKHALVQDAAYSTLARRAAGAARPRRDGSRGRLLGGGGHAARNPRSSLRRGRLGRAGRRLLVCRQRAGCARVGQCRGNPAPLAGPPVVEVAPRNARTPAEGAAVSNHTRPVHDLEALATVAEGSAQLVGALVRLRRLRCRPPPRGHVGPEDLREVIGRYQTCVAATVARHNGLVAKYMGDGVLVYFGYPQAHEDDAERAVRAGLELVTAVRGLEQPHADIALQCRIGVSTGLVVVGDLVGTGAAQEQAVVGETPNLAARLQALAEPDGLDRTNDPPVRAARPAPSNRPGRRTSP
jgi:hypothetical protein